MREPLLLGVGATCSLSLVVCSAPGPSPPVKVRTDTTNEWDTGRETPGGILLSKRDTTETQRNLGSVK